MIRWKRQAALLSTSSLVLLTACSSAGTAESDGADGSSWEPTRDVSFVVPANAGGGQDLMARTMAEGFQAVDEGLTIAVENRPGGSSAVGYSYVQQREGDAEMLITATISLLSLPITTDVSYTWESFTPIAMIGEDQALAVVREDSEHETLTDAVDAASTSMVRVGVAGQDGPDAVTLRLLAEETRGEFQQVVFQSGAESVTALLAGDIDVAILNPNEVAGQLESGDVRALAVFSEERYPEDSSLGEVPTAAEQGVEVSLGQLRGIVAPPGLSESQQEYWVDAVEKYTKTPEYEAYVEGSLMIPKFLAGDEFADYMAEQESILTEALGR